MESCGMNCIKYLLFLFNLIFAISGIALIVVGGVVLADVDKYSHFLEDRILGPPIVLIVVGSIIFVIAFLGCFGAIRESYGLLIAFAVCLIIIFITELTVGIVAAVYKGNFEDGLRETLKDSMKSYNSDSKEKTAWEDMQYTLKCCGTDGPQDWQEVQVVVPQSCCKRGTNDSLPPNTACSPTNYYEMGCWSKVKVELKKHSSLLLGVGIGIAFIQILGIILSCLLASTIKREGK